tara:strand:+ start:148 stop:483 length:336 start_codon:yes stop_codon:yes gene_type:complete
MIKKEKTMNLETYLETNNFEKKDLTILFSVGCVINTENGDTFPLMNDNSIDFSDDEKMNVVTDDFDQYWFEQLGFGEEVVVKDTIENVKNQTITDEEVDWLESKVELSLGI